MVIHSRLPWLLIVAAAVAASCIQAADSGAFKCAPGGACPSGQICGPDDRCYTIGEVPDAGAADAGPTDAGQADAGSPDAGPIDAGRVCPDDSSCNGTQACGMVAGCTCLTVLAASSCCLLPKSAARCNSNDDCCAGSLPAGACTNGQCGCEADGGACTDVTAAVCCPGLTCLPDGAGNKVCQ
jgi:hypothetical protein